MSGEWKNPYNSFNSLKGLLYAPQYQAVANKQFLPPIEASLDLVQHCNLSCQHCNAGRYLKDESVPIKYMDSDHIMNLIKFLGEWGVKSCCYGGGGESTLHRKLPDAIRLSRQVGMDAAVITNGTVLNSDLLDAYPSCRFLSISIDAGKRDTYKKTKGLDLFDTVINNVHDVVERLKSHKNNSLVNCDVCYKFLITQWNQYEIYDACVIAKQIGVRDFYVRPADYNHQGINESSKVTYEYDLQAIEDQFRMCKELETEQFRVFTVTHKYNSNYTPKKDFSQCYGAPVCIQICPDDNVYFCVDTRYLEFYKLGTHYPDPKNILNFWGKEKHKELVFETGMKNCTSRCTYGPYCKQAEELFIKKTDPMCAWFT